MPARPAPVSSCRARLRSASVPRTASGGRRVLLAAQAVQLVEDGVQALALDELHGVVVDAVVLADAEDRHDVGVVQPGRGPGLAAEPLQVGRPQQAVHGQHLQRDVPAQRLLHGLVDDAHAAAADLAEDAVVAQLRGHRARPGRPPRQRPVPGPPRSRAPPSPPGRGTARGSGRPARGSWLGVLGQRRALAAAVARQRTPRPAARAGRRSEPASLMATGLPSRPAAGSGSP